MQQFGPDRGSRHMVSRCRSQILGERAFNPSHHNHAKPLLAGSPLPPTQTLGDALFALGSHQGFTTFSATLPDYKILVVFPDRLKGTADYLQYSYHDDRGTMQIKRIP